MNYVIPFSLPKWRNGRRTRLKIWRQQWHEGSTPSFGTISFRFSFPISSEPFCTRTRIVPRKIKGDPAMEYRIFKGVPVAGGRAETGKDGSHLLPEICSSSQRVI